MRLQTATIDWPVPRDETDAAEAVRRWLLYPAQLQLTSSAFIGVHVAGDPKTHPNVYGAVPHHFADHAHPLRFAAGKRKDSVVDWFMAAERGPDGRRGTVGDAYLRRALP